MRFTSKPRSVEIDGTAIRFARTEEGVLRLWADNDVGLATGLGFAHAHDRLVQMALVRLVAQGRLSECLKSSDETVAIDTFMRELGLANTAEAEAQRMGPLGKEIADAYALGVNRYLDDHRRPLEMVMAGYRPEPWEARDSLATIKLMSYVGLAQSQQDMEKFVIESLRGGVDITLLQKLLSPHLDGIDAGIVDLLQQLRHVSSLVPDAVRWFRSLPTLMASNNWVVSGERTASGAPIACCDPHLECNRLPAIWYEAVMHTSDDYRIGITMPGLPGLVMGRTRQLSFGFTYGFMDLIDYFVEDCRDGASRRGHDFRPFDVRQETILRKDEDPIVLTIRESDLGVLEADPHTAELEDGYYLTRAWSSHRDGSAASLEALAALPHAEDVQRAQEVVREVAISANWLLADRSGNIGYQQSGLLPNRCHSGLFPIPAWDAANRWRGTVAADRLNSKINPPEGYLFTANNDLNPDHGPLTINLCMGPYRADRIRDMLEASDVCTVDRMQAMQGDLYSLQAERFMEMFRPYLPETFAGRVLARWDCRYDIGSRAATLFEKIYESLLTEVFAKVFGDEVWQRLMSSTALVADYYDLFDTVLFGNDESWFPMESKDEVLRRVVTEVLTEVDPVAILPWGVRQQVIMENVFFKGRLPMFLGFDHGPIQLPGNRATITQGGVFESHDRLTTFTPSWRFVTDLGGDRAWTALAGGPSGRRFSKWYTTDVERWLRCEYKVLKAEPESKA